MKPKYPYTTGYMPIYEGFKNGYRNIEKLVYPSQDQNKPLTKNKYTLYLALFTPFKLKTTFRSTPKPL